MSLQELFSPYLDRFTTLLHQNAIAKVELSCKDGTVSVNIFHDLRKLLKPSPKHASQQPTYMGQCHQGVHLEAKYVPQMR